MVTFLTGKISRIRSLDSTMCFTLRSILRRVRSQGYKFSKRTNLNLPLQSDYLRNEARTGLRNCFRRAKLWLKDNIDTAMSEAKEHRVADWNKPNPSKEVEDLPSSSSWLSNKVRLHFDFSYQHVSHDVQGHQLSAHVI